MGKWTDDDDPARWLFFRVLSSSRDWPTSIMAANIMNTHNKLIAHKNSFIFNLTREREKEEKNAKLF